MLWRLVKLEAFFTESGMTMLIREGMAFADVLGLLFLLRLLLFDTKGLGGEVLEEGTGELTTREVKLLLLSSEHLPFSSL